MKVTEHVEYLLRQGRKPAELVELGFPKPVVTRVRRQLEKGKPAAQAKVPKGEADTKKCPQTAAASTAGTALVEQELACPDKDIQKVDDLVHTPPEVAALVAAAQELGTHRRENCPYQEDGLCILRTWADQREIPQGIGEAVLAEEETPCWYIKPSPFYCAMCTRFLEDCMADVESEVSGDPLSGAKDRITCQSCGSKGFIAAPVKCTRCGRQMWSGWHPKQ